ncbi:MAG: hypothetical protein GXP29_09095 [Planctomycetes bacterium]|nr:hypothetical protein [Planctomycetota bacterium]
MNNTLSRDGYDNRWVERRRLVGVVAALVVLGGLWQVVQGPLVRASAGASAGCSWREYFVDDGLREAGYRFSWRPWPARQTMSCLPRPGWVLRSESLGDGHSPSPPERAERFTQTFVDGNLRLLGKFVVTEDRYTEIELPPMDIDGDGHWEVRVTCPAIVDVGCAAVPDYLAVMRMGPAANEIVWLGIVDERARDTTKTRVKATWRDTDGDGMHELVFVEVVPVRTSSWDFTFHSPETIAEFALDRASGLLRTRVLTDGCGITPWDPPSDAPVKLDQTAKLEDVFFKLLPPPSLDTE